MITQTIKNWLHKLFAWWPWKQPAQVEYTNVTSTLNKGTTQESLSLPTIDGAAAQTGISPYLPAIEELPERTAQSQFPASSSLDATSVPPPLTPPVEITREPALDRDEASSFVPPAPTPQQRLEFLQYLVKRGIVNEGFEENNK